MSSPDGLRPAPDSAPDSAAGTAADGRGTLAAIGLAPAEEAAYELLVGRLPTTVADLTTAWQRPEPLADVLATLEARDLASRVPGPPDRYTAVPPDIAIEALLLAHERQMREARRHVDELATAYRGHTAARRPAVVERVNGRRAVVQRLTTLHRTARHELRVLVRPPDLGGPSDPNPGAVFEPTPSYGQVICRVVYQRDCLELPGARSLLTDLAAAGAQARTLPALPVSLCLVDDRLALLQVEPEPGDAQHTQGAVMVYPSGLLVALGKLFDALWERAAPVPQHPLDPADAGQGTSPASQPPNASEADYSEVELSQQQLVALLLSGSTDEVIARQLGVGYRTLSRRIATLMTELGARNRFQAGVQAAFRDFQEDQDPRGHRGTSDQA
ncbi:helix-turn-helix domain-containing protein [Micromonospora sp. NBC_01412]|uniref:helix-turn-helix domain-containing protein n=1 Tax=Micromonospora sp. NBC_01412 TaxID=2903590 RepID=UPI003252C797